MTTVNYKRHAYSLLVDSLFPRIKKSCLLLIGTIFTLLVLIVIRMCCNAQYETIWLLYSYCIKCFNADSTSINCKSQQSNAIYEIVFESWQM